jgi:hypothetical protein
MHGRPLHQAHAGDDAAAGGHALVQALAGELAEFEEGRTRVEQHFDPMTR